MAIGKGSANRVTQLGNLGANPELAHTKSGAAVTTVALATNEVWKDSDGNKQERAEWHRIVLWRRLAENCLRTSQKGQQSLS